MRYAPIVDRLANEGARAWDVHSRALAYKNEGRDIIVLSIGDPDFDTPAPIVEACIDDMRSGDTHYSYIDGSPQLRAAVAAYHQRNTGQAVSADNISMSLGAQGGLFGAAACTAGPGDEIIVPQPVYVTYESVVHATGAEMVSIPLRPERDFHLDPADVEAAVTPRTRSVMINTPHNPTGAAYGHRDLEGLAEVCRDHDLWLISDEVYSRTLFDGRRHLCPATLDGMAERTIVVDSLSKSHAMTGWRVGWVVGPPSLRQHLYHLGLAMHYGLPTFIQQSVEIAFTGDFPEIATMLAHYQKRRDLVLDRLKDVSRIRVIKPEGSCFMMVDIRDTGLTSQEFSDRLLEEAGVSLLAGEGFGPSGSGFLRFSLTAPSAEIAEACDRFARFVRGLNR
ncbi:MAG: aminotransferase class I/II-fold pyridoxal phosphate-dependent enzyme [Pseudomonadota bacterium]